MKTMTLTTFEGTKFAVNFDRTADCCYSCRFPHTWVTKLDDAQKYNDYVTSRDEEGVTFHTGSLQRLMNLIVDYVQECEL